jgi:F-type H+-transporting ATPase subunit b
MQLDAEFFVAAGFVCFAGVAVYFGAAKKLTEALDARGRKIEAEFAEARRLREEAEALLASFKKKAIEAEAEAAALVAHARAEAEALMKESAERMKDYIERRRKQADEKIALAETQATAQVRAAAADAATKAAEIVLRGQSGSSDLVSQGISDLKRLMH